MHCCSREPYTSFSSVDVCVFFLIENMWQEKKSWTETPSLFMPHSTGSRWTVQNECSVFFNASPFRPIPSTMTNQPLFSWLCNYVRRKWVFLQLIHHITVINSLLVTLMPFLPPFLFFLLLFKEIKVGYLSATYHNQRLRCFSNHIFQYFWPIEAIVIFKL